MPREEKTAQKGAKGDHSRKLETSKLNSLGEKTLRQKRPGKLDLEKDPGIIGSNRTNDPDFSTGGVLRETVRIGEEGRRRERSTDRGRAAGEP